MGENSTKTKNTVWESRRQICTGDRVEILHANKISGLRHRKEPVYGFVTNVDGAYIDVRPTWRNYVIELYPNELRFAPYKEVNQ